jgi:hypothetical protein
MFTVQLSQGVYRGCATVSAKAATFRQALGFIGDLATDGAMLITGPWNERDGRYVMDVYDWCACWFSNPLVMAQVIAPPGFTPVASGAVAEPATEADSRRAAHPFPPPCTPARKAR